MPAPIDYASMTPPVNITQQFGSGLQLGANLRALRDQRAAAELARQQQEQYGKDLQDAMNNPTPQAFASLTAKYPQQKDAFKQSWDILSKDQQDSEFKAGAQAYSAIRSGNVDVAKQMLAERIDAMKNSNKDTTQLDSIMTELDRDPQSAAAHIGLVLSSVDPERWGKMSEQVTKEATRPADIAKARSEALKVGEEVGLTKAQTTKVIAETRLLGLDAQKAMMEAESLKKSGGVPTDKKFDYESKLRNEYTNRSKNFVAAQDAFNKLEASAKDESGAGDIALVTSFMKMLDPGSVVRETEFATARDTGGLLTQLQNTAKKLEGGSFLSAKQRQDFMRLAKKYQEAANKLDKQVRKSIDSNIENYGLNPDNVYGKQEKPAQAPTGTPSTGLPAGWSVKVR